MLSSVQGEDSEHPQEVEGDLVGVHWVVPSPQTLIGLVVLCDEHLVDGVLVQEREYDAGPVEFLTPQQMVYLTGEVRGQRVSVIVAEGVVLLAGWQWIQDSIRVSIAMSAIVSMSWFKCQLYQVVVVYFYGVGKPVEQRKAVLGHRFAKGDFLQVVD